MEVMQGTIWWAYWYSVIHKLLCSRAFADICVQYMLCNTLTAGRCKSFICCVVIQTRNLSEGTRAEDRQRDEGTGRADWQGKQVGRGGGDGVGMEGEGERRRRNPPPSNCCPWFGGGEAGEPQRKMPGTTGWAGGGKRRMTGVTGAGLKGGGGEGGWQQQRQNAWSCWWVGPRKECLEILGQGGGKAGGQQQRKNA